MTQTIIVGAGSLGRELYMYLGLHVAGVNAFFVDDNAQPDQMVYGHPVVDRIRGAPEPHAQIFVAIANPAVRRKMRAALIASGLRIADYKHNTATRMLGRSEHSQNLQLPYSLVSTGCKIEPGLLLNVYASVGHDCTIGHCCTFGPYAGIAGGVTLGDHVTLGMGAKILPGIKIGHRAVIGAGAVVLRDVPDDATVFGNPARICKTRAE